MPTKKTTKKARGRQPSNKKGGEAVGQEVSKSSDKYTLDETDHKLLNHIMSFPQSTFEELAELVGMSNSGVRKRYKRPAFQKALEEIHAETWDIIKKAQNLAARRLMKLVQDGDKRIALEAIKMVMQPILNKGEFEVKNITEIIHRTKFGSQGQMISEKEEVEAQTPKNTLELLRISNGEDD